MKLSRREEIAIALKQSIAKVEDKELREEIINYLADYELAWRGYWKGKNE